METGSGSEVTVARNDMLSQMANVSLTTLFTTVQAGWYFIFGYVVLTQAGASASVMPSIAISWTDSDTGLTVSNTLTNTSAANVVGTDSSSSNSQGSVAMFVKANTAIQFQTAGYSSTGATQMLYDVHLRVQYVGT